MNYSKPLYSQEYDKIHEIILQEMRMSAEHKNRTFDVSYCDILSIASSNNGWIFDFVIDGNERKKKFFRFKNYLFCGNFSPSGIPDVVDVNFSLKPL